MEANQDSTGGIWLVRWKKLSGRKLLTYDDAVEEALCFGWIDSKPNKLDALRSLLWFAPRKAGTGWSQLNKARVERLIAAGQMTPQGLAKINAAKADGSWDALNDVENLEIPEDLAAALSRHQSAAEHFEAFPRSAKRSILEWISNAKTPQTRARRVDETASKASRNERANQWRAQKRCMPSTARCPFLFQIGLIRASRSIQR